VRCSSSLSPYHMPDSPLKIWMADSWPSCLCALARTPGGMITTCKWMRWAPTDRRGQVPLLAYDFRTWANNPASRLAAISAFHLHILFFAIKRHDFGAGRFCPSCRNCCSYLSDEERTVYCTGGPRICGECESTFLRQFQTWLKKLWAGVHEKSAVKLRDF
jgi:hypothetical protein